jgi:hypothetical protein
MAAGACEGGAANGACCVGTVIGTCAAGTVIGCVAIGGAAGKSAGGGAGAAPENRLPEAAPYRESVGGGVAGQPSAARASATRAVGPAAGADAKPWPAAGGSWLLGVIDAGCVACGGMACCGIAARDGCCGSPGRLP